jgi:hypothetical protein
MGVLPIATDVWGETTKFPLRFCHLLISTMCAMNSCQLDLFFKTVFSWWRRVFVLPKAFRCAAYSMRGMSTASWEVTGVLYRGGVIKLPRAAGAKCLAILTVNHYI